MYKPDSDRESYKSLTIRCPPSVVATRPTSIIGCVRAAERIVVPFPILLLIHHSMGVLFLDRVLLACDTGTFFSPSRTDVSSHEVLEPGHGEDGYQVDGVASQVVNRNRCAGGDEDGGASGRHSDGASQMHAAGSGLQKEDLVGLRMPVSINFLSRWDTCRKKDKMR
jgi:hypothetical protein